jgi:hypothetical protein
MKNKNLTSCLVFVLMLVTVLSASAQNQDDLLFRRRVVSSGVNGLFYGAALVAIVEPESDAAIAGIPIITAGLGALLPVLTNEKWPITVNQQILTTHGQLLGWGHGAALSALVMGDNLGNDNNFKIAIGMGALGSIGMGIAGKQFGKNKPWSEGQAAMFAHWGGVGPLTTTLLAASFSEDARLIGGSFLVGGAAGYLVGNKVNKTDTYTRGDVRAIGALSTMNGLLGTCIAIDILDGEEGAGQAVLLIPAAGVISGTLLGHVWMKNTNLTPSQGMTTIWSSAGGALLGLGVALLVNPDEFSAVWYAIPYATSLGAYAFTVEMLRKKNAGMVSLTDWNNHKWNFSFMPQNYFLNEKISSSDYKINGQKVRMQPFFSASVTF